MRSRADAEFSDFVQTHSDALARFARLLVANRPDAEDLLQVALLRVYRRWSAASSAPVAYTKATLVNLARDGYRRNPRIPVPVDELELHLSEHSPDIADAVTAQSRIEALLMELPARQRVTVVLRVLDGLSTDETAEIMGCSAGTVKSNLARGLERLRDHMATTAAQFNPTTEVAP